MLVRDMVCAHYLAIVGIGIPASFMVCDEWSGDVRFFLTLTTLPCKIIRRRVALPALIWFGVHNSPLMWSVTFPHLLWTSHQSTNIWHAFLHCLLHAHNGKSMFDVTFLKRFFLHTTINVRWILPTRTTFTLYIIPISINCSCAFFLHTTDMAWVHRESEVGQCDATSDDACMH